MLSEKVVFDDLTPLHPHGAAQAGERRRTRSEHAGRSTWSRPIGKGQRGLIVAPPRTGKTILLQKIANSHPDEPPRVLRHRPADRRAARGSDRHGAVGQGADGRGHRSTFDEPPQRHIQVAEMVIEKAKRMVEYGRDVVILLDSITRLARAYNTEVPHSGKILSGGIDANALQQAEAVLRRRPQHRGGRLA